MNPYTPLLTFTVLLDLGIAEELKSINPLTDYYLSLN